MPPRDLLTLPFDTYQRYRLVADLTRQLTVPGRPLAVLDVGGRTALLRDFLPEAEVTLVDVEESDAPELVLGSGTALPFADRSFDVVCACDTLEHVPPGLREDFVREACRVARFWVVLAGPYDSPQVVEAEELLRILLREKLDVRHRYLDEHAEHGLPDRAAVEGWMRAAGAEVETVGHANLERWLALIFLSMYLDQDAPLRRVAERYYRFYNQALYASDHAAPVYRHAVVACLQGAPRPAFARLLDPPVAPEGSVAAFQQLVGELTAFDREQEVYQAERERLLEVNSGLEADLAGHRAKLAELLELRGQQAQVIGTLEQDLAGHVALAEQAAREKREHGRQQALVIEALERDLAEHRDVVRRLEEDSGQQEAVIATLEQDLAGHVALAEQIAREAREHDRQQGLIIEALERDLVAHREVVAGLEETSGRQSDVIDTLEHDLGEHRKTLAAWREEQERTQEEQARFEAELQRTQHVLATLEDELAAHAQVIREQQAEIEQRVARQAEVAAHQLRLESELQQANELAVATNDELCRVTERLDSTVAELQAEQQANEFLRRELNDRLRNLGRALAPRKKRF